MKQYEAIYTPLGVDGFEICQPKNNDDFERIDLLVSGEKRGENWNPIQVKLLKKDKQKSLLEADSPWYGSNVLIFKNSVVQKMKPTLEKYGELLPLKENSVQLFIYNPWTREDVLDSSNSEMSKLSTGKIIQITKYAFHWKVAKQLQAFKIPNLRVSPVFLSQSFVDEWNAAGFTGLEFIEVWRHS